ncbi:MAG: archaellin/type IV pilin N-terminal domain-containing protein [Candidatus Aenigmatarchaeota archaeon]
MPVKGISPLVATVLLIAFTVASAAIISFWLLPFLSSFSKTTSEEAEIQLKCSRGGVYLFDLNYNLSSSSLSGKIENTGSVSLGNFALQIVYLNYTTEKIELCFSGGTVVACENSNLTLLPRNIISFSVLLPNNYDIITLTTNCSVYGVYDRVTRDEINQI